MHMPCLICFSVRTSSVSCTQTQLLVVDMPCFDFLTLFCHTSQDGIRLQTMSFPGMALMQVRFVQRDVDPMAGSTMSVGDFEKEKFKVRVTMSSQSEDASGNRGKRSQSTGMSFK